MPLSRNARQRISAGLLRDRDLSKWMSELPEKLWDRSLCDLAIPGSHDTMSYCLDKNSPLSPLVHWILRCLDRLMPFLTRPEICKWSTTQDFDLSQQLEAGIRFLDLRIARKPNDTSQHFYFAHGIYTTITVREALTEMDTWLGSHPKELVILSCKLLEGLEEQEHRQLITMMKNIFGSKICLRIPVKSVTLRWLWESGSQVIISYGNAIAEEYRELWPSIPYWWGDTYNPKHLIQYLERQQRAWRADGFFVAGINLTESWWYILTHLGSSLKRLTFQNNPVLIAWVKAQKPGPRKPYVNIIAGDFIQADHLVHTVIELNNKLL